MSQLPIEKILEIAIEHHRAKEYPQAEALYKQILDINPNHVEAVELLAVVAMGAGQYGTAVDLFKRAITLNPGWPETYHLLGHALIGNGQIDEGIAAFQQAIAVAQKNPEVLNLGLPLEPTARLDGALASYRIAIAHAETLKRAL